MAKQESAIWFTTQFEAAHYWPEAPEGSLLKTPHRHMFHVKVEIGVSDLNRQIEFIDFKREVTNLLRNKYSKTITHAATNQSCEMMALELFETLIKMAPINVDKQSIKIDISEDGENGASFHSIPGQQ